MADWIHQRPAESGEALILSELNRGQVINGDQGFQCGFPLVAALTPRSVLELALLPDVNVAAVFKASPAHLIPYR